MTRRDAAVDLLAAVAELPPGRLAEFLDDLGGLQCVADVRYQVRRRSSTSEKYAERNRQIREQHAEGRTLGELAMHFGLSRTRIFQIVQAGRGMC
jgi:hypothetical protein